MILCLDCGNTRLKWGLRNGAEWVANGALAHSEIERIGTLLPSRGIASVIGCNVAGPRRATQIEAALGSPVRWIAGRPQACGVVNCYDEPARLGADRWAALIGARSLHRGAALVVLAGTATTIDALRADGRFEGGLILPGLAMMTQALASSTAQLPLAQGSYRAMPRNTHDAIASGAIHATLGAIERMFGALLAAEEPTCLFAGGAADILWPHAKLPNRPVGLLVLEGLARIAADAGADRS